MEYKINKGKKSQIELVVTFTHDEVAAKLDKAASIISERVEIKGFRKGKAPKEKVAQQVGEMKLYEHAAEILVHESYPKILMDEKIEPLRQPQIEFEKLAPNNEFVYKAQVVTVPKVTVGDIKSIKVKEEKIEIPQEEITKVIDELREYSATETLEDREAKEGDKVELDFTVSRDGVPIEGGQGQKYPLVLGSGQMIPGFEDQVTGMKKGEEKEFELAFPKEYHAKHLAGKKATFKVKLLGVYKRTLPEATDEFAKTHGHDSLKALKDQISHNMEHEKQAKQDQKIELEILEQLIKKSEFDEIPDILVDEELNKMIQELQQNIMQQGMEFPKYLESIKKTEDELRLDLAPKALDRVKAALLTRQIFFDNEMKVSDEELDAEIEKYKQAYQGNEQVLKSLESEGQREMIRNVMGNSKVMQFLKNEVQLESAGNHKHEH